MLIYTNVAALTAYGHYKNNVSLFEKSLLRLSTGLRINTASDDPSGLAIADKLRTQASSIKQGIQNANNGIAFIQIADKAMSEQSRILDLVKSKLIQAKSDTTSTEGKEAIKKDIHKLLVQLDNIASQTNYNGITLLQKDANDITSSSLFTFQVGESSQDTISTSGNVQSNTTGLGIDALKNISTLDSLSAGVWMSKIDDALSSLNVFRSDFGSTQNQLESSVRFMRSKHTNLKKSESLIRDVDYAQEFATLNKLRILMIAGMYALAQANKVQENMLKLLFK
ncbi:flagellin [Arcobacter sp. 31_11_sub10_T18]|nr:flagellin [Arcobacter sp. 31_11_sub10_T18]